MQARRLLSQGLLRKARHQPRQRLFHAASDQRFALSTNTTLSSTGIPVFLIHPSSLLGSARGFSQSRNNTRDKDEPDLPLANEKLVAQLMRQSQGATSANDVQVRLVVDAPNRSSSSSSQVVSLFHAIQTSIKEQQDLIGVANNQDIPVVRVMDLNRFQYQKRNRSKGSKAAVTAKGFRFSTSIAENDLDRKVGQIVKALRKGHNCELMVRCKRWEATKHGPDYIQTTVERVHEKVRDVSEQVVEPTPNPDHTIVKWSIRPSAQLKRSSREN